MMVQTMPARQTIAWVDDSLCLCCRHCDAHRACQVKALLQIDPGEPPFVDVHRCMGCLDCVDACPNGAIQPIRNGAVPH